MSDLIVDFIALLGTKQQNNKLTQIKLKQIQFYFQPHMLKI